MIAPHRPSAAADDPHRGNVGEPACRRQAATVNAQNAKSTPPAFKDSSARIGRARKATLTSIRRPGCHPHRDARMAHAEGPMALRPSLSTGLPFSRMITRQASGWAQSYPSRRRDQAWLEAAREVKPNARPGARTGAQPSSPMLTEHRASTARLGYFGPESKSLCSD
jgi:hypothetical protein